LGICLALPLTLPATAAAGVPPGFFGTSPQTTLTPQDFRRMASLGLTVRVPVYWFEVEPQRGRFEFDKLDTTAAAAAAAGLRVLPFVYGSPSWVSDRAAVPPLDGGASRAWREFLAHLVRRYGTGGSFWRGRSNRRPIRRWQIWNEPNFPIFWRPRPSPAGYVRLLRTSAQVIRRLDPAARIVAAGVAPVEDGMYPWTFVRRMYRIPGAGRAFDIAALHPYATSLGSLEYELRRVRQAMARGGDDSKPLLVTEIGVASDGVRPNPFDKGAQGQARFLEDAYRLLLSKRRRWRLAGAYWFTWQDVSTSDPYCVFCQYAGLFDAKDDPKPAWWALRRTIARAGAVR
jgi:polysaccharide biosynthesis protein PslG